MTISSETPATPEPSRTTPRQNRLTAPFAERAVDWVVRQAGQLVPGEKMQPSFLLVGGKRCGSTTLHRAIIEHPGVVAPRTAKGSHYFDVNHAKGARWYRSHFPSMRSQRRIERSLGYTPITGESSPYYSFHPLAPQRIAAELPDARLILCVRDPIERAWSHFRYESARGFESLDFRAALDAESTRLEGQHERLLEGADSATHRHNTYLARGRYVEHLEMIERSFDRSHIHVVVAERLFADPEETMNEVWNFLGLPPHSVQTVPRLKATAAATMSDEDRTFLREYYAPWNARLATWLGTTLPWTQEGST